jgi:tRNA pseudouridine13 synthase
MRGRCRIAIRVPGCRDQALSCADNRTMDVLLSEDGIKSGDFCAASDLVQARFDGASRPISLATRVITGEYEHQVTLSFSLDPGQYATTICREYMKADPLMMI